MSTEGLPSHHKEVAAGQALTGLGAAGKAGDHIFTVQCLVTASATSQVQLQDGGGAAFDILPANVAVGQVPGTFNLFLSLRSQKGGWKISTGAGVSVIVTGDFS